MKEIRNILEERIRDFSWTIPKNEITELIIPSIRISTVEESNLFLGCSKFGGLPDLKINIEWPTINEKPLAFLGQINFSNLEMNNLIPTKLKNKLVSFFISGYQEHYRETNPMIHKILITENTDFEKLISKPKSRNLEQKFLFRQKRLEFVESISMPSYQHWKIEKLDLNNEDEYLYSDEVLEIYNELLALNYQPGHQLFGYSDAIQGDTNSSWAAKHLNCEPFPRTEELINTEKAFNQLIQFDLMKGFESISDGCAYFGFIESDNFELQFQCELQNM